MKINALTVLLILLIPSIGRTEDIDDAYNNRLLKKALPGIWTINAPLELSAIETDGAQESCTLVNMPSTPISGRFVIRRYDPVPGDRRYFAFRFSKSFLGAKRRFNAGNAFGEGPRNSFRATPLLKTPTRNTKTFLNYDFENIERMASGYSATIRYVINEQSNNGGTYCAYTFTGTAGRP